jgi:hypothetical protein
MPGELKNQLSLTRLALSTGGRAKSKFSQSDLAVECVAGYGFKGEEVRGLVPLQFGARNLDSGGELRGKIKV